MRENADQKNSEYRHFSRSKSTEINITFHTFPIFLWIYVMKKKLNSFKAGGSFHFSIAVYTQNVIWTMLDETRFEHCFGNFLRMNLPLDRVPLYHCEIGPSWLFYRFKKFSRGYFLGCWFLQLLAA